MNNYIISLKKTSSKLSDKLIKFCIENKKFLIIWFFLIFAVLFAVSFGLYLFSGIGLPIGDVIGDHPTHNGVWFIDDYVGTEKPLVTRVISNWDSLKIAWVGSSGFGEWPNQANLSYTLYVMNKAVFPIWIASVSVIVVVIILYYVIKRLIAPWVKKNIEILDNNVKINNENQ